MTIPAQLRSRKFWLTVSGIVSTLGAWFTGEISAGAAITALVAVITGYNAAEGYVDGKRTAFRDFTAVVNESQPADDHTTPNAAG